MNYQKICLSLLGITVCLFCIECNDLDGVSKNTENVKAVYEKDFERVGRNDAEIEAHDKSSNKYTATSVKKSKTGKIKQKPLDNIAQKPFKDKNGDIVTAHSAQHYPYLVLPSVKKNVIKDESKIKTHNVPVKDKQGDIVISHHALPPVHKRTMDNSFSAGFKESQNVKKSKPGKIKQKPLDNIAQKPLKDKNGDIVTAHSAQHFPYLVLPSVKKKEIERKGNSNVRKEALLPLDSISDGKRNLVQFRDSFGKVIATLQDSRNWNNANVTLSKADDARRFAEELKSAHYARHKVETGNALHSGMITEEERVYTSKKSLQDDKLEDMIKTGKFDPKIFETDKSDLKNDSNGKLMDKEDVSKWMNKTKGAFFSGGSRDTDRYTNITIMPHEKMVHVETVRDKPIDFNYESPEDKKANELPTDWKSLLHADDISDHIHVNSDETISHSKEKKPCKNDEKHAQGVLREHTGDQRWAVTRARYHKGATVAHKRSNQKRHKRRHSHHKNHEKRTKTPKSPKHSKSKREIAMLMDPIEFYDELDQMNEIEEEPNVKVISSPKKIAAHTSFGKNVRKSTIYHPMPVNYKKDNTDHKGGFKKAQFTFKRPTFKNTSNIRSSEIFISRKNATSFIKNKKSEIDQMSETDFLAHTTPSIHSITYDDDSADEGDVRKTFATSSFDDNEHEKSNEKPKLVASYENYDDESEVTKNSKTYEEDREDSENNEKDPVDLSYNDDVYVADGNAVVTKENNNDQYSDEEIRPTTNLQNSFVSSDDYISDSEPLVKPDKEVRYFTRVFHPTTIDKARFKPTAEKQEDGLSMKKTNTEEIKEITDVLEDPPPDGSFDKRKDTMHIASNETNKGPISFLILNQEPKTDRASDNKYDTGSLGFKTIQSYGSRNKYDNKTKTNSEEGEKENVHKGSTQKLLDLDGERENSTEAKDKDKVFSGPPDEEDIIDAKLAGDKKVKEYVELMKKLGKPTGSSKTDKMNNSKSEETIKKIATVTIPNEKEKQEKDDQTNKEDNFQKLTNNDDKLSKSKGNTKAEKTNSTLADKPDKTESKIVEKLDSDVLVKPERGGNENDKFAIGDKEAKISDKKPTKININLRIKPDENLLPPTAQTVLDAQNKLPNQQVLQQSNWTPGSQALSSDGAKNQVSINSDALKESLKNAFRDFAKEIKSETQKQQKSKQQSEIESQKPASFLDQNFQNAYQLNQQQQQYQPNVYSNAFAQTLWNSLQNNQNNLQAMQQSTSKPNYLSTQETNSNNDNNNNNGQTKARVDIPGSSIPIITPPNAYEASSMYNPVPTYIYNSVLPYMGLTSPIKTNEGMMNRKETVNKPMSGYYAPTRDVAMDDYLKSQIRRVSDLKPSIQYDSSTIYSSFSRSPTVSEENSQRRQDGTTASSFPCNPMPQCESPQPVLQTPVPYVESPKPVLQAPVQYPPPPAASPQQIIAAPQPQTVAAAPQQSVAAAPPQPQVVQQVAPQVQQQPQQVVVPQVVSQPVYQLASPTQPVIQATTPPTTTVRNKCKQPPCDSGAQDCFNPPCINNQMQMSNSGCMCPDNTGQCSCMPNPMPQFDVQSMMMQVQCMEPPCMPPFNNMQNNYMQPCFNPPCDNFMTPPCNFPPCFPSPQQCQNPPCNQRSSAKTTPRPVVVVKPPEAHPQTIVIRKPAPPPKIVKIVRHASPKVVYAQPTQPPKKVVYAAPPQQTIVVQRPTLPPKIVYAEPPKRKVKVVAAPEPEEVVVERPVVVRKPQIIESEPVIHRPPPVVEKVIEKVVEPPVVTVPPVAVTAVVTPAPVVAAAPAVVATPAPPAIVVTPAPVVVTPAPPAVVAPPPVVVTPAPPAVVAPPPVVVTPAPPAVVAPHPVVVTPAPVVTGVAPAVVKKPGPGIVTKPNTISGSSVVSPAVAAQLQNEAQFSTFLNGGRSSNLIDEVPLKAYTASQLYDSKHSYMKMPELKVDCKNPLYSKTKNCLFDFKKEANKIKSSTYLKSSDSIERLVKGISQKARANGGSINAALEDQISDYVAEAIVDARKSKNHRNMFQVNGKPSLPNGLRHLDLEETRGFVRHEIFPKLTDLHFQRSTNKPSIKNSIKRENRTEHKSSFLFPESKLKPMKTHLKLNQQPMETIRNLMELSKSSRENTKKNDYTSISSSYKNWQKYYNYLQGKNQKQLKHQPKSNQKKEPVQSISKVQNQFHKSKLKSPAKQSIHVTENVKLNAKHDKTSLQDALNHLKKDLQRKDGEVKMLKQVKEKNYGSDDVTELPVIDLFEKLRNKKIATEHVKVSRKHHEAPSLFNFIGANENTESEDDLFEQANQAYILNENQPSGENSNAIIKGLAKQNEADSVRELGAYTPISDQPVSWHSNAEELTMQNEVGNSIRREQSNFVGDKKELDTNYALSNSFSSYPASRMQSKDNIGVGSDLNAASNKNLNPEILKSNKNALTNSPTPFASKASSSKVDRSSKFSDRLINKLSDKARMMLQSADKRGDHHSKAPSIMNDELSNNFDSDMFSSYSSAAPTKFYEFEYDVNKNNKYAVPTMRELKRMEITLSKPDTDVRETVRKIEKKIGHVITKLSTIPNGYMKLTNKKVLQPVVHVGYSRQSKKGNTSRKPNRIAIDITPISYRNMKWKKTSKHRKITKKSRKNTVVKSSHHQKDKTKAKNRSSNKNRQKRKLKTVRKTNNTNKRHINNKHASKIKQNKWNKKRKKD